MNGVVSYTVTIQAPAPDPDCGEVSEPVETRTPVIPNEPVVNQTYGSCINGVRTEEAATILLPSVPNGRWINPDPTSETTIAPSFTFKDVKPGEYTFNFITAEGNFYIPEQPSNYLLVNGVVSYTVVVQSTVPQPCLEEAVIPTVKVTQPTSRCLGRISYVNPGKLAFSQKVVGATYNGSTKIDVKSVPNPKAPVTFTYTFKPAAGHYVPESATGQYQVVNGNAVTTKTILPAKAIKC